MIVKNYKKIGSKLFEVGDLIRFENGVIALVLKKNRMVLLKYEFGGNWFDLCENGYEKDINNKKYKIIARKEDWDIVIKPDASY